MDGWLGGWGWFTLCMRKAFFLLFGTSCWRLGRGPQSYNDAGNFMHVGSFTHGLSSVETRELFANCKTDALSMIFDTYCC